MSVLYLCCSPRVGGNCDVLTKWAREADPNGVFLFVRELGFSPCDGCGRCESAGVCKYDPDGATDFYAALERADRLVLLAPVYFSGPDARTKGLIDRAQVYWAHPPARPRIPLYLCAAGGQTFADNTDGLRVTLKNFGAVCGASLVGTAFFHADRKEEIDTPENRARFEKIFSEWGF